MLCLSDPQPGSRSDENDGNESDLTFEREYDKYDLKSTAEPDNKSIWSDEDDVFLE